MNSQSSRAEDALSDQWSLKDFFGKPEAGIGDNGRDEVLYRFNLASLWSL
jgi:hypothetical protein